MRKEGKHRLLELGKDLLILLLAASALWLASRPQLYGSQMGAWFSSLLGSAGGSGDSGAAVDLTADQVIRPVRMAVMTDQGRYATPYNSEGTLNLFTGSVDLLNEALSSAQTPQRVSAEDWETALQTAPGFYYEFPVALPLSALGELLPGGGDAGALTGTARRLCMTVTQGGTRLFYLDEDAQPYACRTDMVTAQQLESAAEGYSPNGVQFAFERADCGSLAPYTMLPALTPTPLVYQCASPVTEENRGALLAQLSFREQAEPDYEATDGLVYLDGGDTLRLGNNGEITFIASAEQEARFPVNAALEQPTPAEYISAAASLVQRTLAPWQGMAQIRLTRMEQEEDSTVRLLFDYYLDGAQVIQYSAAATVEMSQDRIVRFVLIPRSYAAGSGNSALLPVAQAVAAVSAMEGERGDLLLCYHDNGTDLAQAGWIVTR